MEKMVRKYWYMVALILILIGTIVLRYLTPNLQTTKTPVATPAPNIYQGVAPGISMESDITKSFGTPIKSEVSGTTKTLDYPSDYKTFPTQFVIEGQTLSYSIERVDINQPKKYEPIFQSLGTPNATAYTKQMGEVFPLRIFASKGIAFARNDDGTTFEIWRFSPMTISDFFNSIGKDLSQTAEETF